MKKKDFFNHYKTFTKKNYTAETLDTLYKRDNVVIAINKETKEAKEYIYYYGDAMNYLKYMLFDPECLKSLGTVVELFDLKSGELVYFYSSNNQYNSSVDNNYGYSNLMKIIEENDIYMLNSIENVVGNVVTKDWYSLENIKTFEKIIKLMTNDNKSKSLTK